ncbi:MULTISPECIES: 3-deoxy-7-phosphoheptulonate synthase [Acidithiobacillus]|uniref:3-deoxy-7-phosphoheptulonate synthase n=2 Tax=Acidithiobacillus ferrivorans TaxID=160808 RepID=A0A1B9BXS2_9PROT|nr:3-deoxy-7-phosphoheptulonate synthase [Acidithiobacillus ferrivorans]MBN6739256.1 3-deoxy-7-phosphoheptulonate synthase [Acidithiobacillus sp. MC6.1]AEM47541.1 phospho-2-dehydro-3-deoxyheptonate aldolase [Acidithiobacillus ferrivorans SS3]MBU2766389.1 3-deoxy-7-phosphoheptulonate synthase [Acidithiobacillus ferrivorans]MBU2850661.1 3-deoxy-7-phosphoheptulonate synthase [Acidithiobacillus ferrivorans]OCB02509.1 3-deoxy-7-phosphoheptulonate synthase [Acidithiobacillus ferrivorans]
MIVIVKPQATAEQMEHLLERIRQFGLQPMVSTGSERTVVGLLGDERLLPEGALESLPAVEQVMPILKPYKLVSREFKSTDTVIEVRGIPIGGKQIQVIAGPCSVETPEQMRSSAEAVKAAGCRLMRGGAFKPRTSPYTFQGVGDEGLDYFRTAADAVGLPIVTELMDVRKIDLFLEKGVDIIQIGTRNMQNFDLLKEVGRLDVPVILKRGLSATIKEWLMAAEYIAAHGNHRIIFAERGIRTFETAYRNVLDVTAIPVLKRETHLPVIVDPSHAGGKAWLVPQLSKAAIAAGADGLLVESHPCPEEAWCDADQALSPQQLMTLMGDLRKIAEAIGREL